MKELDDQIAALARGEKPVVKTFATQIAMNVIPFIDAPYGNDYTKEEMKMQNEGRRILHAPDLRVNCTCVRVPVRRSHSIALTLRTENKVSIEDARAAVAAFPGVRLIEDYEGRCYPTPLDTTDQDLVWVGPLSTTTASPSGAAVTRSAKVPPPTPSRSSVSLTKTPDFQNPCPPGRGFLSADFPHVMPFLLPSSAKYAMLFPVFHIFEL